MKFTKRELTIIKCAVGDYQFQFVDDTSNQELLKEMVELTNKIQTTFDNIINN